MHAFVPQGLVHISELVSREGGAVAEVTGAVSMGQLVDVVVLGADNGKLSLSMRALRVEVRVCCMGNGDCAA